MPIIRPAVPADAADLVALRARTHPYLVRGVAATARLLAAPPPGEDGVALVAVERDAVIGWARASRNLRAAAADAGETAVHVDPDHRRRGVGAALFSAAVDHLRSLGVHQLSAICQPSSLDFARRRGFEPKREIRYSVLDLRSSGAAGGPVAPPGDVRLVALDEVDEQALYEADGAAATDEPSDLPPAPAPYETWRYEVWDNDDLDRRASTAAVRDGRIVAFTLVLRDGDRLWSDMTATVPEFRGRGLATLVKRTALADAAGRGAVVAYTANAEANRPMLAVNEALGYRPVATQVSCVTILKVKAWLTPRDQPMAEPERPRKVWETTEYLIQRGRGIRPDEAPATTAH